MTVQSNKNNNVLGDYNIWMSGISDINVIKDGRNELGIPCYKLSSLHVNWYSVS